VLHLVRNNSPYTAILLFIFALCTQLQSLMHPVLPQAADTQLMYSGLLHILSFVLGKSAFAYSFLGVVLVYLQALLLNAIAARQRLFVHNTYLVAFAYLGLSALHPALSQFSPMLLVNMCILFAVNELLLLKQAQNAGKYIFNMGFALMIAGLIQFSALALVLFLLFSLIVLRPFSFREWMIMLVGLSLPLYIVSVWLFCTDKLHLLYLWPDLGVSLPSQLKPAQYYLGVFSGLIIWLSISMYNMQTNLPKAPIYIRRCWIAITALLIVSLIAATFADKEVSAVWVVCLPALSLIMAHAFINERSKKMNAISFYFTLALILYCQLFLPL
jgi:general stress protein CsbA